MKEHDSSGNKPDVFIDKELETWIEENKEYLTSMYSSYIEDEKSSTCTFEEFSVYVFYEYSH